MLSVVLTEARITQDPACPSVVLEGRRAGLVGWVLHKLGLARLSLQLDASSVQWLAASVRGQQRLHAATEKVSDAVAGSRRPVLPLLLLPVVASVGVLGVLATRTLGVLVPTVLVCAVLMLIVLFRQRVFLSIRLRSGATLALQWKRGVVEGVTVDQALAQRMAEAIREAVLLANERDIALSDRELEDIVTAAADVMRADTDIESVRKETATTTTRDHPDSAPKPAAPSVAVSVATEPPLPEPPLPASPVSGASTYAPPVSVPPATVSLIARAERMEPTPLASHAENAIASTGPMTSASARLPQGAPRLPTDPPPVGHLAPATVMPTRRRHRRGPIVLGVAVLLAAVGGGTWTWIAPRTVIVRNELLIDVLLTLPDGVMTSVAARSRKAVSLPRGDVALSWDVADRELFRGSGLADAIVGEPIRVASSADSVTVSVGTIGQPLFAPLISNRGGDALRVVVNAGLRDESGMLAETECLCRIMPGAQDEFIGYYRAFANSTVRLIASDGRSVTFSDVAAGSSPRSGAVPLRLSPR